MRNAYLKITIAICFVGAFLPMLAQQQTVATSFGTVNRATPKFGFNATGVMPANVPPGTSGANWSQQWFVDSVITLNPEILRFPGGTNANHWDWKTGWFMPPYQPPTTPMVIKTDQLKPALLGCKAQGIFVVNMEMSTPHYEMDGLRHADSLGLTPTFFELGNEHNLDGGTTYPNQDMSSKAYASLAKVYYDSIKAVFPTSKICAVGGNTVPHPNWNTDILDTIPSIDAFAFHVYLTANNADLAFNVNRALAVPFGSATNNTLGFRYNANGFNSLTATKEVWVTEHNLQETQIASAPVIATTWTHSLYVIAMNHFFLTKNNISVILNHTLSSTSSYFESISRADKHITANAIAMKLLYDVARGSQTCQSLSFSGNPSMTYVGTTIPKLIGWKFNHTGIEKGFICNFSKDTFKISLATIFTNPVLFDQYTADTAFVVVGMSSLNKFSGNSNDSISIYPFSVTQITSTLPTGTQQLQMVTTNNLWMYPNPSSYNITIQTNELLNNAELIIYNSMGQEISKMKNVTGKNFNISTIELKRDTYFVSIKNNNTITNGKFVVE